MKFLRACLVPALLFAALSAFGADVVVLRGGVRIELQKPWVRQGNQAILTRADGTLLSVPVSEIDLKATAAARAARAAAKPAPSSKGALEAPQESPADAARATAREGRKARVKITDADVAHVEEPAESEKKEPAAPAEGGRLEVADFTQEKTGGNLIVRGSIRNAGATPATSARMTVTALDQKGEKIASGEAALSKGIVEPGATVSFSATIAVGEKVSASLRFGPQWIAAAPASPAAAAATSPTPGPSNQAPATAAAPPQPTPTPYGMGTLFAPPVASAPTAPPDDNHRGYIPEFTKEGQPKVPQ